jgi:aminoglycoside 3-N-acetyltransferase
MMQAAGPRAPDRLRGLRAQRMHSKAQLLEQCRRIGLSADDIVMVHASLRAVGPILGGPDVLIDVILESVGPRGTMMMYVGCQEPFDDIGRGRHSAEQEAFILQHCPPFDPATARADRAFGALAELFRTRPGALCSGNPGMRMAALGADADWLTRDHPLNYGLGAGSPLDKLCQRRGKVLLLGSDPDEVTLLHYAENIAPIAAKKTLRIKLPLLIDGRRQWVEIEECNSSTGIRDWPDRFFADIVRRFVQATDVPAGRLGHAATHVLDAGALVQFAIPLLVETAARLDVESARSRTSDLTAQTRG